MDSAGLLLTPVGLGQQQEAQAWAVSQIHHNLSWGQRGCGAHFLISPLGGPESFPQRHLGMCHMGQLFVTSAGTPPKTNLLGEEKERLILGNHGVPPTYASYPPMWSLTQKTVRTQNG